MGPQELAEHYQALIDEELLRLALDPDQLDPDARIQLQAELARRGIDSSTRLDEFREEESLATFDPTIYSKAGSGLGATLRDWRRYHRQTGEWPLLSVVGALVQALVLLSFSWLVLHLALQHEWSNTELFVIIGAVWIVEFFLWDRIQGRLRLKELRSYRSRRGLRPHVTV